MSSLSPSDLLRLPFTPDLTEGGIAYAIRSLPHTYNRMGGSPYDRLRRIVAGVAVELAFRRHLSQRDIPFDVKGATPFTDPDRYDVSLGGHRCDIKSFLITHRDQIQRIHRDPSLLLPAPALIPSDQFAADGHNDNDLYLFAFLTGLVAASQSDLQKAIEAGQPTCLIHAMPKAWANPQTWSPLGRLALKSESDETLTLELSGQDSNRDFLAQTVELPPRTRVEVTGDFYALACVRAKSRPGKRVAIHSPARREMYLIQPSEWGNIWVYGMNIWLTGWMSHAEFRQRAAPIAPGTRVFQYDRTRAKNLSMPINQLKPLADLFERVKTWAADSSNPNP